MPIQLQRVVGQVLQHFSAHGRFAAFASLAQGLDGGQVIVDLVVIGFRRQAAKRDRGVERVVQAQLLYLGLIVQRHGLHGQRRLGARVFAWLDRRFDHR